MKKIIIDNRIGNIYEAVQYVANVLKTDEKEVEEVPISLTTYTVVSTQKRIVVESQKNKNSIRFIVWEDRYER